MSHLTLVTPGDDLTWGMPGRRAWKAECLKCRCRYYTDSGQDDAARWARLHSFTTGTWSA